VWNQEDHPPRCFLFFSVPFPRLNWCVYQLHWAAFLLISLGHLEAFSFFVGPMSPNLSRFAVDFHVSEGRETTIEHRDTLFLFAHVVACALLSCKNGKERRMRGSRRMQSASYGGIQKYKREGLAMAGTVPAWLDVWSTDGLALLPGLLDRHFGEKRAARQPDTSSGMAGVPSNI